MRHKILNWQWFRDFFNITIFRYFVTWFAIVPFFAKLTQYLPRKINIQLSETKDYYLNLALPFKWEILWISSLLFVAAYVLYLFFAPVFVRRYFSLKDYKEYEHSPRWIVWESQKLIKSKYVDLEKFVGRMIKKDYVKKYDGSDFKDKEVVVDPNQTYLMFTYKDQKYQFAMPIIYNGKENEELTNIAVREIFWEVFARFSSSKFGIRLIIQILLLSSLGLFAIPFIQSIISGFQYLFK
mgnify:FL=1